MICVGIDPGITGGIAVIKNGKVVLIRDMPVQNKGNPVRKRSKKTGMMVTRQKKEVDPIEVYNILDEAIYEFKEWHSLDEKLYIYIEQVSAGVFGKNPDGSDRTQGVTSAFSLGDSYGVVRAIASCVRVNDSVHIRTVRPVEWKKFRGLIGEDKDKARLLAINLYHEYAHELKRKKDIGRGDAVMIADYGYAKEIGVIL